MKTKNPEPHLQVIDTLELVLVTGGKGHPLDTIGSGSSSSSGSNNDALLSTLTGIQGSLQDLGKNQNNGLFGGANGMMFMTMALAMSQRQQTVVVNGGGGGGGCWGGGCHHGFRFRVW